MGCVKKLGMIFLAIYLIISGLIALGGINLPTYVDHARQLCAVVSGILLLIAIGSFSCKHTCEACDHEHKC
jgi:hypothetical protein